MDIEKHLKNAWLFIKEEPLYAILGGFLAILMNLASIGIMAGPIFGSYMLGTVLYLRQGRRPVLADLFVGFQRLGEVMPFLVVTLLLILGFILFLVPGLIMMTWWVYVLLLMADQRMPLAEAMAASRRKVKEKGFFMHLVFIFLISFLPSLVINMAASVLPPLKLLQVLAIPIQAACLASLYLEQFPGVSPPLPES